MNKAEQFYLFCKVDDYYQSYSMKVNGMDLDKVEQISGIISEQNENLPVVLISYQNFEETMDAKDLFYLIKGLNSESGDVIWSECFVNGGLDSIEKIRAVKDYMSELLNVKNYEVLSWEIIK